MPIIIHRSMPVVAMVSSSTNCDCRRKSHKQQEQKQKQLMGRMAEERNIIRSHFLLWSTSLLLLLLLLVLPTTVKAQQENIGISTRIVGGTIVTNPTKYPYYLEWKDAKCGASLIHDDSKFECLTFGLLLI
jgi:hypothetical protein